MAEFRATPSGSIIVDPAPSGVAFSTPSAESVATIVAAPAGITLGTLTVGTVSTLIAVPSGVSWLHVGPVLGTFGSEFINNVLGPVAAAVSAYCSGALHATPVEQCLIVITAAASAPAAFRAFSKPPPGREPPRK
jgi:hypothetical protein